MSWSPAVWRLFLGPGWFFGSLLTRGIPHVESVLRGQMPPAPYGLAPVKFAGGLLSIGAGLALGREGPSVQIGASMAVFFSRIFGRTWPDCRSLIAAGAGAGLAAAFNAPIAGSAFVLEELVQSFEHRIAITTLAAREHEHSTHQDPALPVWRA